MNVINCLEKIEYKMKIRNLRLIVNNNDSINVGSYDNLIYR